MDDVTLEDHGSHKCTETAHTAVSKLLLDSRHFFGADTDFQVQCTLLFIFHFSCSPFLFFSIRGRRGSALCQALYHVGSLSARPHDTVLATQVSPLWGECHFRAFWLGLFSRFRELELCDFLYFVAPHNQYSALSRSRQ